MKWLKGFFSGESGESSYAPQNSTVDGNDYPNGEEPTWEERTRAREAKRIADQEEIKERRRIIDFWDKDQEAFKRQYPLGTIQRDYVVNVLSARDQENSSRWGIGGAGPKAQKKAPKKSPNKTGWVSTGRKVTIKVKGVRTERTVYRNAAGELRVRKMVSDKKTGQAKAAYVKF
jgi:hypothetical protein